MKIKYVKKRLSQPVVAMVSRCNSILEEYAAQGFVLTVRQLYYKLVARDWFPESRRWTRTASGKWVRHQNGTMNAEPNYKWLIGVVKDARLAGLMDWQYLEDRTRALSVLEHFDGARDALQKLSGWYHVDMWQNQEWRPEVWIEKDALVGVIQGVCQENDVPYFSCRGYTSLSEMWRASIRLRRYADSGQTPFIIHFGDHDPSGMDMSRDITERLRETFWADCEFQRVALNMDQVEEFKPPPDPAKVTDSRYAAYVAQFGEQSWELDALEPVTFRELIEGQIASVRNDAQWKRDTTEKNHVKKRLEQLATDWEDRKPRMKK